MLKNIYVILFIVFLVVFPKGGIKINEIPITWGYILLFSSIPFCVPRMKIHKLLTPRTLAYLLTLPFSIYSLLILSVSEVINWGYAIALLVSIILMPSVSLIISYSVFGIISFRNIFIKTFKMCVRIVILFGLFHFFIS
jgi:hypothetical protein